MDVANIVITAGTAAATSAAFTLAGEAKIIAPSGRPIAQ